MNKGDSVKVFLTDLNNLGCGVGRLGDGRVVFVPGGVTGDTVQAKLIKINSGYCVARLMSVEQPSVFRLTDDPCSAPESCGGCVYRHVTYEKELELKRSYVQSVFRKAGFTDVSVGTVVTAGKTCGYRNKAQYPVQNTKNGLTAGFFASKTHRISAGADCPLQPVEFAAIVRFVTDYAEKSSVRAYDETDDSGILRHIYIRSAAGTGEIMVCPVIRREHPSFCGEFARKLQKTFPSVSSVMLNYNRKNTNVVTGDEYVSIGGKDYIEDILLGLRFRITPSSFWQVNRDGAELLYSIARERAELTGNETLLDLYCGTGSIGLTMAKHVKSLTGIEIVPDAVLCAKQNAAINGIDNASFYCGDASDTEGILGRAEHESGHSLKSDVVILDPPRKGTTPELIGYIAGRGINKVIYISCGPDTLARDCALFAGYGYNITGEITPVDMFPRTGHVETVVLMSRAKD